MPVLVVATGNPGKVTEFAAYLKDTPWDLQLKPAEIDVVETGKTFAENAALKATTVAQATGQWAIADDSGLAVRALGGAPGLYSARYGLDDENRIRRVLYELKEFDDRYAEFLCAIAVARPDGSIALDVEGACPGKIVEPQGEGGFGYDPIFYVPEAGKTFAAMDKTEKRRLSHRGRAIAELLPALESLASQV
ncbi:MAG: RdgB/HAM1 family non-canonical purine NTP pyrophosphatase [Geitlerinemataceae cyanobacterium]